MGQVVRETLPLVDEIARVMQERGLSARQVAVALDVSHGTVPNWLKGNTTPPLTADMQARLAAFLEVSPRRVIELYGLDLGLGEALRPYVMLTDDRPPLASVAGS